MRYCLTYIAAIHTDLYHKCEKSKRSKVKRPIRDSFQKLANCSSDNSDVKTLCNFLDDHKDIIITPTDKTKNVSVFNLADYIQKLNDVFDPAKFVRLTIHPLKQDLIKYRALRTKICPYLSVVDEKLISPTEAIKKAMAFQNLKNQGFQLGP